MIERLANNDNSIPMNTINININNGKNINNNNNTLIFRNLIEKTLEFPSLNREEFSWLDNSKQIFLGWISPTLADSISSLDPGFRESKRIFNRVCTECIRTYHERRRYDFMVTISFRFCLTIYSTILFCSYLPTRKNGGWGVRLLPLLPLIWFCLSLIEKSSLLRMVCKLEMFTINIFKGKNADK